jgi:membrane associated rhomboid family serine protease
VPELGASGAIATVLGTCFLFYPGSRIRTWIFPIFLVPKTQDAGAEMRIGFVSGKIKIVISYQH